MKHAVELIAACIPEGEREPLPCDPVDAVCCVTGRHGLCLPSKWAIKKSFTNLDVLAAPNSGHVSVEALLALNFRAERTSSWICDGRVFKKLTRAEVRAAVFAPPPDRPWSAYATTSYKKHGSLWAPVNTGARRVWRFETLTVDLTTGHHLRIWETLRSYQDKGITRPCMETLDADTARIRTVGAKTWMAFTQWALLVHQSPVYRFMCYLLPSADELAGKETPREETPNE